MKAGDGEMNATQTIDCLLINPQPGHKYPPISLLCLTAYARKSGFSVEICDTAAHSLSVNQALEVVDRLRPSMVGYTLMTSQFPYVKALSDGVRGAHKEMTQIAGGTHVNAVPEECLNEMQSLDYLVLGEGEQTFVELLHQKEHCGKVEPETIAGLAYRDGAKLARSKARSCFEDLDVLPMAEWDAVPVRKYEVSLPARRYSLIKGAGLTISTSRGCPFSCQFCASHSVFPRGHRRRSAKLVVDELEKLNREYRIDSFFIVDEVFFQDKDHLLEFCAEIKRRGLKLSWAANSRVNSAAICDEVLRAAAQAGCVRVDFGVESGSAPILKEIGKGIKLDQVYEAHKAVHRAGIATTTLMMVGHPWENYRQILESLALCACTESEYPEFGVATPFPATELFEIAGRNNWLRTRDWSEYRISNDFPVMRNGCFDQRQLARINIGLNIACRIFGSLSALKKNRRKSMRWSLCRLLRLYQIVSNRHQVSAYEFDIDKRARIVEMYLVKDADPVRFRRILGSLNLLDLEQPGAPGAVRSLYRRLRLSARLARIAKEMGSFEMEATKPDLDKLDVQLPESDYSDGERPVPVSSIREQIDRNEVTPDRFDRVIVFGTGESGKTARYYLEGKGFAVGFWCDNNASRHGKVIGGVEVIPPSMLRQHGDMPVVIASLWHAEIAEQLRKLGQDRIFIF